MTEAIFEEIIKENFPKRIKNFESQNQKLLRMLSRIKATKTTHRHIIMKLLKIKDKEKIIKANRERQYITFKEAAIRPKAKFSVEIMETK